MRQFGPDRQAYGTWGAVKRFVGRRHIFQLLAYVLLAAAIAYSINLERNHATEQRHALAQATTQQFIVGCERGNKLRLVLVGILEQSRSQIAQAVKRGQIDQAAAKQYNINLDHNIAVVSPVPCTVTPTLRLK